MPLALLIVAILALLGHGALCLWVNNHLHALGWNRTLTKAASRPVELFCVLAPLAVGGWSWSAGWSPFQPDALQTFPWPLALYAVATACVAVIFLPPWLWRQLKRRPPAALESNHTSAIDVRQVLGDRLALGGMGRFYGRIPGNQSLWLHIHEKVLQVPRLPAVLDGLSIAHLSDLHLTGRVGKAYFEEVVRRTNDLNADMIVLTGDLVDKAKCIDWLSDTLARLGAPQGVYFVLGNHDLRVDAARVRRVLTDAGLIDLSGRWLRHSLRGRSILLAGNELPWIRPAADMPSVPRETGPQRDFRIAVCHTPDQIGWARRHDFDLMLAGHTHGGQICLPLIGPILAPSHYGVRYAAGTFDLPPTLMHVSRGVSGLQPLRFNCPPELTKLVLGRRAGLETVESGDSG